VLGQLAELAVALQQGGARVPLLGGVALQEGEAVEERLAAVGGAGQEGALAVGGLERGVHLRQEAAEQR
jgi:hypothetical protein